MRLEHEYVAEKLNGEVAEFRPVTESTKFELVINLKTAKVLALTIPPGTRPGEQADQIRRGECQMSSDNWIEIEKKT
jgi:hypothetical protein